ncbi:alpha/beta fold hydrolase [Ekhidna sp.]
MRKLLTVLISLFICSVCFGLQNNYAPSFKESKKTTHKISKKQKYIFGYLEVPENRGKPNSNTIKLPVYIFKSRHPNPQLDPVIYTVGGPGYTSMKASQYMNYYQYLDDRDFILFEQRGTQYAKPNLACPEWSEAVSLSNLPGLTKSQTDSLFMGAVKACRSKLIEDGADLEGYNTKEIAADIEDLRKVLGIDKYNLLTISYSTKIAQVLLRDYPDAIRSVVMDSPLPLEVNYDEESVSNLLESTKHLLTDCEVDPNCNNAYPNLKERFLEYLRDKTDDPLVVEVENPNTNQVETFYLKGYDLITVFSAASTSDVMNVPYEMNKLLNNDLSAVKEQLSYLFQASGMGNGVGMRLSVWCAEEYPFTSQKKVIEESYRYPEIRGLSPAVFDSSICDIWGVSKVANIENKPIKSDIPVLLMNGEYDSETPVKWALDMKKNLPNSFHLIFKGWKHTVTTNWANPCAMETANAFFNNPNMKPNPDCFQEIERPRFKTD